MRVTKQQFIDGIFKLATSERYKDFDFHQLWSSGFVFEAIGKAGFVLVEEQALHLLQEGIEAFPPCKGCDIFESSFKTCFGCAYRQTRIWFEGLREFLGEKEKI